MSDNPYPRRVSRTGAPAIPFGRWLLHELDLRGMTPADLARATTRHIAAVSQWTYNNPPNLRGVIAISRALGIPIAEVVAQVDPEAVDPPPTTTREQAMALVRVLPEPLLLPAVAMLRGLAMDRRRRDALIDEIRAALPAAPDRSRHADGDVAAADRDAEA